jgi:SMC interacting uncharacterized protein involved in chromosome segregation
VHAVLQEVTAHKATKKELVAVKSDLPKAMALKAELQKREEQIATLRNEHTGLKVMLAKQKRGPSLSAQNNAAVRMHPLHA